MLKEMETNQRTGKAQGNIPRSRVCNYVQRMENQALFAAGFEPAKEEDLWRKDDVWFGRRAALQKARQKLCASNEKDIFDEEA
jgi:hypothetical protein